MVHLLHRLYGVDAPASRHNYQTRRPSFKRHNLVNIQLINIIISENIAEGMLSLQI